MILAADSFDRANASDLGTVWDVLPAKTNLQIVSNAATAGALGGANCIESYNGVDWPPNQWSETVFGTIQPSEATGAVGPAVRCSVTAWTHYVVLCEGTQITLASFIAGAFTSLGTAGIAAASGDVVLLDARANTLNVYVNAILRIGPITDANIPVGRAGIYAEDTTAGFHTIASWRGGDFLPPPISRLAPLQRMA